LEQKAEKERIRGRKKGRYWNNRAEGHRDGVGESQINELEKQEEKIRVARKETNRTLLCCREGRKELERRKMY